MASLKQDILESEELVWGYRSPLTCEIQDLRFVSLKKKTRKNKKIKTVLPSVLNSFITESTSFATMQG